MSAISPKVMSQIFTVDPLVYPNGMSVTSTYLCFKTKDDHDSVSVRIHPVVNGVPDTTTYIPGAECTLSPAFINTSDGITILPNLDDDNVASKFAYTRPVLLVPGDYALTIDTLSPFYTLHMADITKPILGTSRQVSRPAAIKSFFRTQNTLDWSEDPKIMIMFKHKVAVYSTLPKTVTYTLNPDCSTQHTGGIIHFDAVDIKIKPHKIKYTFKARYDDGTLDTSDVDLLPKNNIKLSKRLQIPQCAANGFNLTTTISTTDPSTSPVVDPTRHSLTLINYVINNGELSNSLITITNAGLYANNNASSIPTVTIDAPSASGGTQATAVVALNSANQIANIVFTNVGSGYYVTPNIAFSVPAGTLINATANFSGETGTSGGNALARYISRKVTLADGFDATDLRVWLTCNKQANMDVQVYYKVLSGLDPDQNLDHRPWVRMVLAQNSTVVSQNDLDYIEYTWQDANSPSITYTGPGGYVYNTFKVFAVKVTMYSTSSLNVPSCKDLRVLALA